ncbi:hypothetical protein Tco_0618782 [Tanacetum coccineum]
MNKSVATPHKKTVASDTTIQKPKSYFKELYGIQIRHGNGRIFSNVRLRWVPTGKLFNSCTGKVDNEPTHGSIPHMHACKQTLGLSAGKSFNGQKQQRIDLNADALYNAKQENLRVWLLKMLISKKPVPSNDAPFLNVQMTFEQRSSSLVLHQMTSDHNRSKLGIQDHSNEQSSSKLVPKVVPLSKKGQHFHEQEVEITILLHIAIAKDNNMSMLVKDTRSQDGIDDKDNDKGSKSRSQSMKEQTYNKEQRKRPRPHELNDKSNLIDLMKELIIGERVKVNQKARILELKQRNHEEHCSDNLYVVFIKEDTAYSCPKLHSKSTKRRSIRRIQKKSICRIGLQVMEYSGI